jgi:hypothetical protein
MKYLIHALGVLLILFVAHGTAGEWQSSCHGFAPPNSMQIPVGQTFALRPKTPGDGGISEREYDAILYRIVKIFGDEVKKLGGKLKIHSNWSDPTVNAFAERFGDDWIIEVPGGIARHKAANIEGVVAAVCHELGHHLGGAPKHMESDGKQNWATNEGGADYYSALKCMRRFFAEDDNATIVGLAKINLLANKRCLSEFANPADQLICLRESIGTESVANLLGDLSGEKLPSFETPDVRVVKKMINTHPDIQCRPDTFFDGSVCHVDQSVPNSNTDYKEGACVQPNDDYGWRPRCWFLPPNAAT